MNNINWNQIYKHGASYTPISEIVLDLLKLKGSTALDIGCGAGDLLGQLIKRGFSVTGVDLSDVAIKKAQEKHPGTYMVGDFMSVAFGTKFDLIFINKVLAFAKDKQAFVDKAISLLNDNGKIVIVTPVLRPEYHKNYSARLKSISVDMRELEAIMPDGWTQIDRRYFEDYGEELTIIFDITL